MRLTHGHGHAHGLDVHVEPRVARFLTGAAIVGAVATLAGLIALWPRSDVIDGIRVVGSLGQRYDAEVRQVDFGGCSRHGDEQDGAEESEGQCLNVTLRLLAGPDRGEDATIFLPDSPTTPDFEIGEKIVLGYEKSAEEGSRYSFVDRQRKPVLALLVLLFAVAVVVLGRLRGAAALVGLAVSIVVLVKFVAPAILSGRSPVLVAVVGAAAIAYAALYLAHGFNPMTTVALLGALGSLCLTVVLAQVFVAISRLSGFASEEAIIVRLSVGEIDVVGLVLAGVVIGALGALDDMTVTQASAVWELRAADPRMSAASLYRSGLRIGRDHVASTVNTLLLAYAGASMPLLLFFVISRQSLGSVANEEVVATEIIRTLVGSIGLVASVPITTWLAARVAVMSDPRGPDDATEGV
ncbi:MAG TPA: YibE/F family protein [Actinomycetota bacterium]|nr:YibE/F family protein [Actinomycetota bacterium]